MAQLNLNMDPQEALDNINAHDHASGLGNQITTAGIVNNAVTADKLAAAAVTAEKIASNAVTTEKVADGSITAGKIAAGVLASSGVVGLTDYIGKGAKIKPNADLSVAVEPLEASIAGAYQQTSAETNVSLDARKASLIYAQKGEGGVPVLGKVNAVYPEADANTVLRYTFNEVGNPQDTSGNENHVTTMVGCTRVDGWADYAKKGDGSTGYMVSGATTGFPTGASERELTVLYTCHSVSPTFQYIAGYGLSSGRSFNIMLYSSTLNINIVGTTYSTGFDFEVGKTYLVTVQYNTSEILVYINGVFIYKVTVTLNTLADSSMYILRYSGSSTYFAYGSIHYLELRNKIRTPAQVGQIANKLCLPCRYIGPNASYPTISAGDLASAYHEWKFDEMSGTSVADSAGALNGTAGSSTSIVDSTIDLGKSRSCTGGANGYITCGSYAFSDNCTIIGVVTPKSNNGALISNRPSGASGVEIYLSSGNGITLYSGSTHLADTTNAGLLNQNSLNFFALSVNSTQVEAYINSATPKNFNMSAGLSTASNALYISYDANNSAGVSAIWDYLLIIPRTLTQAEITQYYTALRRTMEKDIREILPTNSISLGLARTNSTVITEINDSDYKYGRREGATGGNRKVFLGWKYFSGSGYLDWENPFGTRKVNTKYAWSGDANGMNESPAFQLCCDSGTGTAYYGCQYASTISSPLRIYTCAGGVAVVNCSWKTSGYIGCYAEIIE